MRSNVDSALIMVFHAPQMITGDKASVSTAATPHTWVSIQFFTSYFLPQGWLARRTFSRYLFLWGVRYRRMSVMYTDIRRYTY